MKRSDLHRHRVDLACSVQDAEPTDAGGRRGMMEFLPRLRVMFRGEDPEVERLNQKGKPLL